MSVDPFFGEVRRRHPDIDIVLLPPETPQAPAPRLQQPLDIDGDGRQLVVLPAEGGDSDVPLLFAYRHGRLQRLATAADAPPLTGSVDAADGRVLRWWSDGQGRRFSARSTQLLGQRTVVQVEVYRWTVRPAPGGGRLLGATRLAGTQCFDLVNDETPHPC